MPNFNPRYINAVSMAADITGDWISVPRGTLVGFQAVWAAPAARLITHDADDAVVAGTGTWRFDNGAFTAADVGATVTIAGAANGGNNGAKVILTVPDATHFTTATTSLVNETFGVGVTASLQQVSPTGTFAFDISGDETDSTIRTKRTPKVLLGPTAKTLPSSWSASFPAATASSFKMTFTDIDDPWIRGKYVWTSGGGILRMCFNIKERS